MQTKLCKDFFSKLKKINPYESKLQNKCSTLIWITNESLKQSIINIFLYLFQFPEKIFAQFRLHLNGTSVNYTLGPQKRREIQLVEDEDCHLPEKIG